MSSVRQRVLPPGVSIGSTSVPASLPAVFVVGLALLVAIAELAALFGVPLLRNMWVTRGLLLTATMGVALCLRSGRQEQRLGPDRPGPVWTQLPTPARRSARGVCRWGALS